MRSNKGQALLEFVLILPVLLFLFLGIIDFGRIIYEMNRLESITNDAVDLYEKESLSTEQIESELRDNYDINLKLEVNIDSSNTTIRLSRSLKLLTPGLGIALENPYIVEVKRVINNE